MEKKLPFQKEREILEIRLINNYRIIDKVEFSLNNEKDRYRLLEYIKEKIGISTKNKEGKDISWW